MKPTNEHHWFQAVYFVFYVIFASVSVFMIPFLKEIGYDSYERGIIFSCMALFSIVMQFLIGYLCDKYHILKPMFIVLNIAEVIATYWCYSYLEHQFFLHLLLISLMSGIYKINYNLLDSWILLSNKETSQKFGTMRAFGAVGFALATYVVSLLIAQFSYQVIWVVVFVMTIAGLLLCLKLPNSTKEKGYGSVSKQDFIALLKCRPYILLIVLFLCINIVGTADQYTTIDKLMYLKATNTQIGYKWAIQSLSEIPLFLLGTYILKKFGGYWLMIIGSVCYVVKFVAYGMVGSVQGLLVVTTLQTITYPLITLSSRTLFAQIALTQKNLKTSTQLIAAGVYLGVSALVTPILCGFLVRLIGHDATLYWLAMFLGFVVIFALVGKKWMVKPTK